MEELFKYGFSELEIKEIIDNNKDIINISREDIIELINILEGINCDVAIIKNIIIANIFYLNRMPKDVRDLINKLDSLGIKNLNIVFDSNPFLLNKDVYEIDEFINNKLKEGMNIDDITGIIESSMDWME